MFNSVSAFLMATTFGVIPALASSYARCRVNGKEVPCSDFANGAAGILGFGILVFIIIFIIGIASFIFWIRMVIHVIKHDIENKPLWVLVLLLTGIAGAIVYYFAIAKKYTASKNLPPIN